MKRSFYFVVLGLFIQNGLECPRSMYRPVDPLMPYIEVFYTDNPCQISTLRGYCLRAWAIFGRYNKALLDQNRMPAHIPYRYEPEKKVSAAVLDSLINELLVELSKAKRKKWKFKHFKIIKDKDFNYKYQSGLIILKFKDYPFFIKLFLASPQGFTRPYSQSFEMGIMYGMGGCPNRFCSGFTRIPNLIQLKEKIQADPYWRDKIALPNKWYWTPQNVRMLRIVGYNMGNKTEQSIEYPSVYAIICEEVALEKQLRALHKHERRKVRKIIQFLGNDVDPHIPNFFIEKGTGKIALIDTEHFASMIGLQEEIEFKGNLKWYATLSNIAIYNLMWQTKHERREKQKQPTPEILKL